MGANNHKVRASVVGASGYTGAELLRVLPSHPRVEVTGLYGHSKAGQPVSAVLPSLSPNVYTDAEIRSYDKDRILSESDVVFCALPHGASASVVRELHGHGALLVDLSADFRLKDPDVYASYYGPHPVPELLAEARYGLVEQHRESIRDSKLIAVPGCYPTASILALAPLLASGLIAHEGIIIDAKSGVSGAGRQPGSATHFCEVHGGIRAYKTGGLHRHLAEIEAELSAVAQGPIRVTFSPHLSPHVRGILALCYAKPAAEATSTLNPQVLFETASSYFKDSRAVRVHSPGAHPDTNWVKGTCRIDLSYNIDSRTGTVIVQSAIDNLAKGASAQAIQAMNIALGFDEFDGLQLCALWP